MEIELVPISLSEKRSDSLVMMDLYCLDQKSEFANLMASLMDYSPFASADQTVSSTYCCIDSRTSLTLFTQLSALVVVLSLTSVTGSASV